MNTRKIFEQDFKESCKHQNLWVWRIRDSYVSAKAVDANAYIPCQPADFLVKLNENIFFCEASSVIPFMEEQEIPEPITLVLSKDSKD